MDRKSSRLQYSPAIQTTPFVIHPSYDPPEPRSRPRADEVTKTTNGERPVVRGKFLWNGLDKLYVRGVTYGTFKPDAKGYEYPPREVVDRDFAQMAANGINAVRTYTPPPARLLDLAARHGLHVMIGLAIERYVGYLIDTKDAPDFVAQMRARVRGYAGHPAILCFAIANEIAAPTVRSLGRKYVERFLRRMYQAVKAEDPSALVTYVNYPSTEYLDLSFLDLASFNVYLETPDQLDSYLARLHSITGDRPVLMSELGLDSARHGECQQRVVLEWQVRTAFARECAGAFIYAWTDEWYRGGEEVHDWKFGLTTRDRKPKPALAAVREAFADAPFARHRHWPLISVVVCTYNGSRTIRETLEAITRMRYPNFEVIVVDDGSSDATPSIVAEFDVRLIRLPENGGLSRARNVGADSATGEIVAYIDDDAYPDPHWLHYLADTFESGFWSGVGGPNLPPLGDGIVAECVANAPGGPRHVLLSDREAEHIPGCNMAFRKAALQALGGFDAQFHVAGDDVDFCWRLLERGWKIGFSPAALVWHHRRNSLLAYWKQQCGYGKAEALLELKWPEKYNVLGHATWAGRVYGKGDRPYLRTTRRIYHGMWGSAPFQHLYHGSPTLLESLMHMPEWYVVMVVLALLSAAGVLWRPLLFAAPFTVAAWGIPLVHAIVGAARARFEVRGPALGPRLLTTGLFLLQPLARLCGRIRFGLSPWRWRGNFGWTLPRRLRTAQWTDRWYSSDDRIRSIEIKIRRGAMFVTRGGDFDSWDLEVRGGLLGAARTVLAVEEQGGGCQMIRFKIWPRYSKIALALIVMFEVLAAAAVLDRAHGVGVMLVSAGGVLLTRMIAEAGAATSALRTAIRKAN
jgi:O-antigen biosynthesis protein